MLTRRTCRGCPSIVSEVVVVPRVSERKAGGRGGLLTPLFHVSQKLDTPTSKPIPKANAPAKIVDTKTPRSREEMRSG